MSQLRTVSASLLALATAASVHGQTRVIYVDQSAPAGGDGRSWESAFANLTDACAFINATAQQGSVDVRLAQGLYRPPARALDERVVAYAIHTPFVTAPASGFTIAISGGWGGRNAPEPDVQDFVSTRTVLSGDVLGNDDETPASRTDNYAGVLSFDVAFGWGGVNVYGIEINGGGTTLRSAGATAIFFSRQGPSWFWLRYCRIEDNQGGTTLGLTEDSGHWRPFQDHDVHVLNCTIRKNSGGSAIATGGWLQLEDSEVSDNATIGDGGAVRALTATVRRSVIAGNRAANGAGAMIGDLLSVDDSLFAANAATGDGGAVRTMRVLARRCTFADNRAARGGAVAGFANYAIGNSGCVFLRNNAATRGADIYAPLASIGMGLSFLDRGASGLDAPEMRSDAWSEVLARNFSGDPGLRDLDGLDNDPSTWRDNDYRPTRRSILVDRYWEVESFGQDVAGNSRFVPGVEGRRAISDIGCYESQVTLCGADVDADGAVGVDDLVAFLVAFENGDLAADICSSWGDFRAELAPNNAVTIDDLVYFLSRFEAGC